MGTPTPPNLDDPGLYINRELSQLDFNRRVLELAKDHGAPLLERLRFLTICSTNLDEFFEIRAAGIKQQTAYGVQQAGPDGLPPQEVLRRISDCVRKLVQEQYRLLSDEILPGLKERGIHLLRRADWNGSQQRWVERYFAREVQPVLTPMGIDPAHPFPRVLNKGLSFIVTVTGVDAFDRDSGIAVLQVPRTLPRLIRLPRDQAGNDEVFVLLSSIIHEHIATIFPGMAATGCFQFRVTRNSDLWVDEEEVDDLLQALKGELPRRKYGEAVRLEVAETCPEEMSNFLLERVGLGEQDLYRVNGPVNLHRLAAIYAMVDRPDLKYPPFVPGTARRIQQAPSMLEAIRRGDVLLHHPYESFAPVVQLLEEAAEDPDVLAIKQTVYRTDATSPVVEALMTAARAGKEVTAVVELRARFDEAANIDLATRLQEAGANVAYGVVGYKAHAKMLLIVRREGRKLRRYVHVGTGNYHSGTARAYTDVGLMTCDPGLSHDVHLLFLQLTGLGSAERLTKVLQSPFTLHKQLLKLIRQEAKHARAGKPARIVARMNALAEPSIIRALYDASRAGVQIDLIVRGVCCLRPGVPGVSENIRVRSILGRFLEHARVFHFHAGGKPVTMCASADWMQRNFFTRVELAFPIEEEKLCQRVVRETLELYLEDNVQAWELGAGDTWRRLEPGRRRPRSAQLQLLEELSEAPAKSYAGERGHGLEGLLQAERASDKHDKRQRTETARRQRKKGGEKTRTDAASKPAAAGPPTADGASEAPRRSRRVTDLVPVVDQAGTKTGS